MSRIANSGVSPLEIPCKTPISIRNSKNPKNRDNEILKQYPTRSSDEHS
jgi:hypothetical protein